jgi:hypothetical protein
MSCLGIVVTRRGLLPDKLLGRWSARTVLLDIRSICIIYKILFFIFCFQQFGSNNICFLYLVV